MKLNISKAEFVIQYPSLISSIDVSIPVGGITILLVNHIWNLSVSLILFTSSHSQSDDIFQINFCCLSSFHTYRTTHSLKVPYCSLISSLCILKLILYIGLRFILPRDCWVHASALFIISIFSLCLLILTSGLSPLILSIDYFFSWVWVKFSYFFICLIILDCILDIVNGMFERL